MGLGHGRIVLLLVKELELELVVKAQVSKGEGRRGPLTGATLVSRGLEKFKFSMDFWQKVALPVI